MAILNIDNDELLSYSLTLSSVAVFLITASIVLLKRTRTLGSSCASFALPPSPSSLPIVGHLPLLYGDLPYRSLGKLADRYGPLMYLRLGSFHALLVSSSIAARELFKSHDYAISGRPPSASSQLSGSQGFLFAQFGPLFTAFKKIFVTELLGTKSLERLRHARDGEIGSFITSVVESAISGDKINVSEKLEILASNIVSRMATGKRLERVEELRSVVKESRELTGTFYPGDFFLGFLGKLDPWGYRERLRAVLRRFNDLTEEIVRDHEERKKRKSDREDEGDVVDVLLSSGEPNMQEDVELNRNNVKSYLQMEIEDKIDMACEPEPKLVQHENVETNVGKRKCSRESEVWDHFRKENIENGVPQKCYCNYCGKSYQCDSQAGTSSKWKHLRTQCKKSPLYRKSSVKGQKTLVFKEVTDGNEKSEKRLVAHSFNNKRCRGSLARMIVMTELPFNFVEKQGFKQFCAENIPYFQVPSRVTVARDCFSLYLEEKQKLKKLLTKSSQKISLTTDTWTSIQNLSYMAITAHFIDENWNYQKRIINFCQVSSHKGEVIGKLLESCLLEWGIENVFSLTLDNASSNDIVVSFIKRKVNGWKKDVLKGEYIHFRCAAHVLNLIVSEGMKDLDASISSIRNAIKYVRSCPSHLKTFKECIEVEKLPTSGLVSLDVKTRWNSTYLMLASALKYKRAFIRLEEDDNRYLSYFSEDEKRMGPPLKEDWDHARILVAFLVLFYDMTVRLSGSTYVTINGFFHDFVSLHSQLYQLHDTHNGIIQSMIMNMRKKFDKYWGKPEKMNVILFVAVVLDPRYKLKFLSWSFNSMYGRDSSLQLSSHIHEVLVNLYEEYRTKLEGKEQKESAQNMGFAPLEKQCNNAKDYRSLRLNMFREHIRNKDGGESRSEVERYLTESVEDEVENFDVLSWWSSNHIRYKILGMIARDVFAIPISSVASESAFSAGGRVLDPFRSSLTPKVVEALICTEDWLRNEIEEEGFAEEAEIWEKCESEVIATQEDSDG